MRIATWNVNSMKARLPFVLHWLAAREPDVVCVQELKLEEKKFPHDAIAELGYKAVMHSQPTWNGVAVLSKHPITVRKQGLPGAEDAGARLVTVDTAGMSVTSVYVPNGKTVLHDDYQLKLDFMRALNTYAAELIATEERVVIAGDFNICPADVDSWAPHPEQIFHTPIERKLIAELGTHGYLDMYRSMYPEATAPDGNMFSWWDYRAGRFHKNQGLRIDMLFASAAVNAEATKVWVDREYRKKKDVHKASDHAPVIAELASP